MKEKKMVNRKQKKAGIWKILEIEEKYFKELSKAVEKKTGLKFPAFPEFSINRQILFLEKFVEYNKILETKKLWEKYRKAYEKELKKIVLETEKRFEKIKDLKKYKKEYEKELKKYVEQ